MHYERGARIVFQSCLFCLLAGVAGILALAGVVSTVAAIVAALGCLSVAHSLVAGERDLPSVRTAVRWIVFRRVPEHEAALEPSEDGGRGP